MVNKRLGHSTGRAKETREYERYEAVPITQHSQKNQDEFADYLESDIVNIVSIG